MRQSENGLRNGPFFKLREIFSESRKSKPNLNCNYTFSIDLAQQTELCLVLNLSENGNYNPNLVWIQQDSENNLKEGPFRGRLHA